MDEEEQTVSKMMQNGTYFEEALSWYQTIYVNIIPERSFFLLIGILAGLIGFCAIIAFSSLMPIVSRRPVIIQTADINKAIPTLIRLHQMKDRLNSSIANFFILTYIANREGYNPKHIAPMQAFVIAHSDPNTLQAYLAEISPQNPQSASAVLGATGHRHIQPLDIKLNGLVNPPTTTVVFERTDVINSQTTQTRWQVDMQVSFTPLTQKEVVDKQSGKAIIQTQDPQFQVLHYERKQLP